MIRGHQAQITRKELIRKVLIKLLKMCSRNVSLKEFSYATERQR